MINFSSTNILFLEKMEILLSIGAFDCEFSQRQSCEISIALEVKNLDRVAEDHLGATYNYGQVVQIIEDLSEKHYQLVEYFAKDIATAVLQDSKILSVEIMIAKLGAFVNIERCGCKIKFSREVLAES